MLQINDRSSNFTSFTVQNALFTTSATGADGFLFDANGATSGSVTVTNSEFTLIDQDAVQINNDGSGTINARVNCYAVVRRRRHHTAGFWWWRGSLCRATCAMGRS